MKNYALAFLTALAVVGSAAAAPAASQSPVGYEVGTVISVNGNTFTLRDATNGHVITVNRHTAMANRSGSVTPGERVELHGYFMPNGVFDALSIESSGSQGLQRGSEVVTIDEIRGDDLIVTDSTNGKHFTANTYTAQHNGRVNVTLAPGARVRLDGYWLANDIFDVEHAVAQTAAVPMQRSGFIVGTVTAVNGSNVIVRDTTNGRTISATVADVRNANVRIGERVRLGGHWMSGDVFDVETLKIL